MPISSNDERSHTLYELMGVKKRLSELYALNMPMTRTDLEDLFSKLAKYYEDQISRQ